jgi:threonine/homoserine/homoserine lactone efflux protein
MGEAIGQVLPFAVGVGLSPIPIIAVVLLLSTPRARVNGPAFLVGWLVGLAAVGTVVFLITGAVDATDDSGAPATWESVLKLVLGLLLLLLAVKQWRGRPHGDEPATEPKWMGAVDSFTPAKTAGAGVVLSAANPKNLVLAIGAAAAIAELDVSVGDEIVAYAVFALIGTIGVAAPVFIYFALGERAATILEGLHRWMGRNNAVIMSVLFLVIGAKLVGDAISGFSS